MAGDPPPLLVLGGHHLLDQAIAELFLLLALGDIHDHADHSLDVRVSIQPQRSERDGDRHRRTVPHAEYEVAPRLRSIRCVEQLRERRLLDGRQAGADGGAAVPG